MRLIPPLGQVPVDEELRPFYKHTISRLAGALPAAVCLREPIHERLAWTGIGIRVVHVYHCV